MERVLEDARLELRVDPTPSHRGVSQIYILGHAIVSTCSAFLWVAEAVIVGLIPRCSCRCSWVFLVLSRALGGSVQI